MATYAMKIQVSITPLLVMSIYMIAHVLTAKQTNTAKRELDGLPLSSRSISEKSKPLSAFWVFHRTYKPNRKINSRDRKSVV